MYWEFHWLGLDATTCFGAGVRSTEDRTARPEAARAERAEQPLPFSRGQKRPRRPLPLQNGFQWHRTLRGTCRRAAVRLRRAHPLAHAERVGPRLLDLCRRTFCRPHLPSLCRVAEGCGRRDERSAGVLPAPAPGTPPRPRFPRAAHRSRRRKGVPPLQVPQRAAGRLGTRGRRQVDVVPGCPAHLGVAACAHRAGARGGDAGGGAAVLEPAVRHELLLRPLDPRLPSRLVPSLLHPPPLRPRRPSRRPRHAVRALLPARPLRQIRARAAGQCHFGGGACIGGRAVRDGVHPVGLGVRVVRQGGPGGRVPAAAVAGAGEADVRRRAVILCAAGWRSGARLAERKSDAFGVE